MIPQSSFLPEDWYWAVGDRIWSSVRAAYVAVDDPVYSAWVNPSLRKRATRMDDEAALDAVLRSFNLASPVISTADVDKERDRRIDSGFVFNGVRFQSRPQDRENIAGATTLAIGALTTGASGLRWHGGDSDFVWIAEDNTLVPMDAPTVIAFGQTAAAWKSANIFAARALKDQSPIPADFAAQSHWPIAVV